MFNQNPFDELIDSLPPNVRWHVNLGCCTLFVIGIIVAFFIRLEAFR